MNKSKIAIVQFYTNNVQYGKFSKAINKRYCSEKGYTYICEEDTLKIQKGLEGRAPTWYKPKLIKEVLETNPELEYVLFLDIDAVVSNFDKNIEDYIDKDYDLVFAKDYSEHSVVNAGVFILKNTEWSKEFLDLWWKSAVTRSYNYANALWHDQTCFTILYETNENFQKHVKIVSNNDINHNQYGRGNFIFHAFAHGNKKYRSLDLVYSRVFSKVDNPDSEALNLMLTESNINKGDLIESLDLFSYNTDKHSEHDYFSLIYNKLLSPLKEKVKKFVEIGVSAGGSIELWRDYFKDAVVYGLDLNLNVPLNSNERLELRRVDQSRKEELEAFGLEHNDIDVLVEDGSHKMYDQQITLATLFKSIKPGGIYILEDLHTSLEARIPEKAWCNWGDASKTITLDMLNNFIKAGKIESDYLTQEEKEYLNNNIESVEIYQSRPDWSITSVIKKKLINTKSVEIDKFKVEADQSTVSAVKKEITNTVAVVLYCFAVNDWESRLTRQIKRLHTSGLYEGADELHLFISDVEDNKKELIKEMLKDSPKVSLNYTTRNWYEFEALVKVDEIARANENCKVLYFHTKGVWNKFKIYGVHDFDPLKEKAVNSWVEALEFFLIDNWKKCIEKLNEYDTVGVTNNVRWWWGNFWWANASHIRDNVPMEAYVGTRWTAEGWLHEGHPDQDIKFYEFYHFWFDPHYTIIPKYVYDGTVDAKHIKIDVIEAQYGYFAEQRDEGRGVTLFNENKVIDVTDKVRELVSEKKHNKFLSLLTSDAYTGRELPEPVLGHLPLVRIRYRTNIDPENEYTITSLYDYINL
jgi:hypothetical protein